MSEQINRFYEERDKRIEGYSKIKPNISKFHKQIMELGYEYNFDYMGRPIIQMPQDIIAMQEIIWNVKPEIIIETGIAHGGSLVFSASMLALLDYCEAQLKGIILDPCKPKRTVIGIDIDIRAHNKKELDNHPMRNRMKLIEGSSVEPNIIEEVYTFLEGKERVLVCLDSNHTHEHVLSELEVYAPMVSTNSYCIVFDTNIEDLPEDLSQQRPWGPGNNPKTAVWEYLRRLKKEGRTAFDGKSLHLEIDKNIENKLLITAAPDGFLKRV